VSEKTSIISPKMNAQKIKNVLLFFKGKYAMKNMYIKGLIDPKKLILLKNKPCDRIKISAKIILETILFI
tara:strand:- start:607 stop:816 length:210 start_codon:yes stop_codon:yes gene_type:complete